MKNENGEGTGISYVIMPIDILQNKELNATTKILYSYLTIFKKGVCFQSNAKLSEMTGIDESTIKRGLKTLADMGWIYVEFLNNNSAQRRIYAVLDNPAKLAYLSRKGMFSLDRKEPSRTGTKPDPKPEPTGDRGTRPKRSDYSSDAEYEKAFYNWNKAMV